MTKIIVTMWSTDASCYCDVELPADVPVGRLTPDIVETFRAFLPTADVPDVYQARLFLPRYEKTVNPQETPEQAGILQGDHIILQRGSTDE